MPNVYLRRGDSTSAKNIRLWDANAPPTMSLQSVYLYPVEDIYLEWGTVFPASPTTHWDKVDDPQGSSDDASTYTQLTVFVIGAAMVASINDGLQADSSVASPTTSWGSYSKTFTAPPSGGVWTKAMVKAMSWGVGGWDENNTVYKYDYFKTSSASVDAIGDDDVITSVVVNWRSITDDSSYYRCSQVYLTVNYYTLDHVEGHPAPTNLEIDRATNPTSASDIPTLTAIWQATNSLAVAESAKIQVSAASNFSSIFWDSGWVPVGEVSHNTRCPELIYSGNTLSSSPAPDGKYYVRFKFKDAAFVESAWSSTGNFTVVSRKWLPAVQGYTHRSLLKWNTDHPLIPAGYTQKVTFKTGTRSKIATDGYFNESIANSGGCQIAYYGNKTHVTYLGKITTSASDGNPFVGVVSYDWVTQQWGTPINAITDPIGTDTHGFPVLTVDNSGYIHIFYGCHDDSLRYIRSKYSNISGSLPGETSEWVRPDTMGAGPMTPSGSTACTYPVAFVIPHTGRIYVFYRGPLEKKYSFNYSDDNGATWSGDKTIASDTSANASRIYMYGFRYDPVKKRLHVGFTFNHSGDVERGVWYAYSDYDDRQGGDPDVGFNRWQWADGTNAGVTVNTPIDWAPTKAIIRGYTSLDTHADPGWYTNVLPFIITIQLDGSGNPMIQWEQKILGLGVFSDLTNIMGAKWSGTIGGAGSWNTYAISDQTKTMLRVRRGGYSTYTDLDGDMHIWLPVNGNTYHNLKTTGNGPDQTGVTVRGGGTAYLEIDDGFSICDGDTTYIDLAASTGKVSFVSNEGVPPNATVIQVEVVAVMSKQQSTSPNVKLFLSDGASYSYGTAFDVGTQSPTTGDYYGYTTAWATNPFTGLSWTPDQVGCLRFGVIANNAQPTRISNVWLRALYRYSTSAATAGVEIWELISADGGVTWTARELTRNTLIGVPIFSNKMSLTNDAMEVVYSSGNDIFYYNGSRAYGLVQPSGIDLRLYYGNTEIDRVIDYGNAETTTIWFKVQEDIPANFTAGPKDYYFYLSNPNETGNPQANPSNVFLFWDNGENYADGSDLDSQGGWSANQATGYSSPPNHSNKLYTGSRSIQINPSGSATHSIGSNVQNVYAECALWYEDKTTPVGNKRLQFQFLDPSARVYGCGFNAYTSRPCLNDNGSYTDSSTYYADVNNYYIVGIQCTSNGVSAWLDGTQLAMERGSTITGVDSIRIVADANSFFDYVRVMQRLSKSSLNTRTSGFGPDTSIAYSTDFSTTYDGTYDGLIATSGQAISKLTVTVNANSASQTGTVTVKCHICPGTSWDASKVLGNQNIAINCATTGANYTGTATWTELVPGPYLVKFDYFSFTNSNKSSPTITVTQYDEYNMSTEPVCTAQALESHGFTFGASLLAATNYAFTFGANTDNWLVRTPQKVSAAVQSMALVKNKLVTAWELNTQWTVGAFPIGYSGWLSVTPAGEIETLVKVLNTGELPVQTLTNISASQSEPVATLMSVSAKQALVLEDLLKVITSTILKTAYSGKLTESSRIPMTLVGWLLQSSRIYLDNIGYLTARQSLPLQVVQSVPSTNRFYSQVLVNVGKKSTVATDYVCNRSTSALAQWIDTTQKRTTTRSFPVEPTLKVPVSRTLPVQVVGNRDSSNKIFIANTGFLNVRPVVQTEFTVKVSNTPRVYPEIMVAVGKRTTVAMDYICNRSVRPVVQVEDTQSRATVQGQPVEKKSGVAASRAVPLQVIANRDGSGRIYIANTGYLTVQPILRVDFKNNLTSGVEFFTETTVLLSRKNVLVTDFIANRSTAPATLNVDTTQKRSTVQGQPVEPTLGVKATKPVPVEINAINAFNRPMPIGYSGFFYAQPKVQIDYVENRLTRDGSLPVDYTASVRLVSHFPEEFGLLFNRIWHPAVENIALRGIPVSSGVEWTQYRSVKDNIPVENTMSRAAKAQLNMEWTKKAWLAIETLPVEQLGGSQTTSTVPVDNKAGVNSKNAIPANWLGSLKVAQEEMVEHLLRLSPTGNKQVLEYLVKNVPITTGVVVDLLIGLQAASKLRLDFAGMVPIGTPRLQVDFLAGLNSKSITPLDSSLGVKSRERIPADWLLGLAVAGYTPVELTGKLSSTSNLPEEYSQQFTPATYTLRIEGMQGVRGSVAIPVQIIGGLAFTSQLCLEYVTGYLGVWPLKIRLDWVENRQTGEKTPVAYVETRRAGQAVPLEATLSMGVSDKLWIAVTSVIVPVTTGQMLTEWKATLGLPTKLPINFVENRIIKPSELPIDSMVSMQQATRIVTNYLSSIQSVGFYQMPVEYRGAFLQKLQQQINWALIMHSGTAHVSVEFNMSRQMKTAFAAAYGTGFLQAVHLLTEYLSGTGVSVRLIPECPGGLGAKCRVLVDSGKGFSAGYRIDLEMMVRYMMSNRIPMDWFGTIFTAMMIRHVAMSTPGLVDPAIAVPVLLNLLAQVSEVSGANLTTAEIESLSLGISQVIDEDSAGGTGMIN